MASNDLFGSRGIPLHIAEHIFHIAGARALTSVRRTNKANADAYSGVAINMARRGLWHCRVDMPEQLEFAVEHRLRCLRVTPSYIDFSLPRVATLDWLSELRIRQTNIPNQDRAADIMFPPKLVVLEITNLGFQVLPPLPADTLKRLVWHEEGQDIDANFVRSTGVLPSSLLHLQCWVGSTLELPVNLPAYLQHLDLNGSSLRSRELPLLPATLTYLTCRKCNLTHLPADLPPSLVRLGCAENSISALPADLPLQLRCLWCTANGLTAIPALPDSLVDLDCSGNNLTSLSDAQLPSNLKYLNCSRNNLRRLPQLPRALRFLNCSAQLHGMHELPPLQHTALEFLECGKNGLYTYPRLPGNRRVYTSLRG